MSCRSAAVKAFVMNRIGDAAFLIVGLDEKPPGSGLDAETAEEIAAYFQPGRKARFAGLAEIEARRAPGKDAGECRLAAANFFPLPKEFLDFEGYRDRVDLVVGGQAEVELLDACTVAASVVEAAEGECGPDGGEVWVGYELGIREGAGERSSCLAGDGIAHGSGLRPHRGHGQGGTARRRVGL